MPPPPMPPPFLFWNAAATDATGTAQPKRSTPKRTPPKRERAKYVHTGTKLKRLKREADVDQIY